MLHLDEHTIQITTLDDRKGKRCEAHRGMDWSSAEAITPVRN